MGPLLYLAKTDLEQQIIHLAIRTVTIAAAALFVLIVLAMILDKQPKKIQKQFKLPLFLVILLMMAGSTLILFASTIYLNTHADSKGPVHWHSEIEFWSCGAELNLRDPIGALSNKVGTATYHEHNDKHIHLEGVVVNKPVDASLGKFIEVAGGYMNDGVTGIPLNKDQDKWFTRDSQIDGDSQYTENFNLATGSSKWVTYDEKGAVLNLRDGNYCSGTDMPPAQLQVFVYSYDKSAKTYKQRKLDNPAQYVMRAESSLGPPADCVIVEYDAPKNRTDKLCQQYGLKDSARCTQFGIEDYSPELCNIHEIERVGSQ